MRKKRIITLSAILLGALMCFNFTKVEASDSIFDKLNLTRDSLKTIAQANTLGSGNKYLGISEKRESGDAYGWNINTAGEGKKVWKIAEYPAKDSNIRDYSDLYYCLNATRGFGMANGEMAEGFVSEYKDYFDMKDGSNKEKISNNAGGDLGANYNKILWILDNSYIPTKSSTYKNSAEYKNLMENTKIKINNDASDLTEEQIEVVQQMAIWYFTNSSDNDYHLSSNNLPSMYMKRDGDFEYKQLSGNWYATDGYGKQIDGKVIYGKMNTLYKYFIENAQSDYNFEEPTLELSGEGVKVEESGNYYVAGPFKLTGTNISKIKEISVEKNKDFILLDSSKNEVTDNDFLKVVGNNGFYLKFSKNDITEDTKVDLKITYKYDVTKLTFITDENDPENTQPVVIIEREEKTKDTNTNVEIKILDVSVEKKWEDANNQDGVRPESIQVGLYENGKLRDTVTLKEGKWTYTWKGLLAENREYTVKELDKNGNPVEDGNKYNDNYNVTYVVNGNKTTITNTHVPEVVEKTVTKIWNDNENQDGVRPNSIQVQLYADGKPIGDVVTILENDGKWSYTWTNLPKYSEGKEIVYTVVETQVDGYTTSYSDDTFTITNSYTPGKVSKTVIKVWDDDNNLDNIQPKEITVILYKVVNGEEIEIDRQKLNASNNWRHTWDGLEEKENGDNILYTVKEEAIDGYETTYSKEDYSQVNTITITNKHTPAIKGSYNVILRKVDGKENELSGATIKVNGKEYTVGKAVIVENANITSEDDITLEYEIEEVKSPEGYLGLDTTKNIKIRLDVIKLGTNYSITRAYLVDENGNQIEDNEISVNLDINTNTININVTNNPIQKEFDLSLRKFITQINDQMYKREPVVDTDTIAAKGTATYKHTKEPIAVQVGDIVNYTIRVYNEGETDGYASEITDYLPEWLDFLPDDEVNTKYLWQQDIENNRKITTNITSMDSASGEEIYADRENKQLLSAYDGGETLDYIDVQIRCRVNEKAQVKQLITNIAEISEMQDKTGAEVITDRDSTKANVELPLDEDLPEYKGKDSNKEDLTDKDYYYEGQEDDDDFEKIVVENFDLSLRKFITALNDTELKNDDGTYAREPVVDTSKLGTTNEDGKVITTSVYNHPKTPLQVAKGDIVTYCIRIYNEGTLAGYANEVIDNIPEGLEFIEDSSINKSNGWELKDGKIVTTYLSDENINNVINPVSQDEQGNKVLSFKDVKVQFKVVAEPSKFMGELITNWAEIKEDSNNDIDSVPGNDVKEEDDIDYEPVKLVYFDLSLKKFITNVNETEYNNRIPEVDTSKMGTTDENGNKITTATYTHTKDPIVLETGSIVTYCIRVYNEGTIAGYANEITDNIPDGLEFLPENEINTNYKWMMLDENGEITQEVSKAKKITTNYLSEANGKDNILSEYQEENGAISLDYKDVKVAFKVVEPSTSDRIVVNTAEISKASDEDIDSVPGNNVEGEDDIDKEYVRVETFDLALQKWVTATKVTYNGKTVTKKTGFDADSTEMAKVDLVASQLKKTTVKFVYSIRVINEGQVAGYATEIKDYVPSGLKFVKEDNPDWTLQKDGTVTTDKLKDTLLQPGQSAIVEITLTWKNSSTNMGVKTNWAEISADSGDDIDSTPDNNNKLEDDIDDAKVILSIKTGSVKMYIILSLISVAILGGGTFAIKKYVINK